MRLQKATGAAVASDGGRRYAPPNANGKHWSTVLPSLEKAQACARSDAPTGMVTVWSHRYTGPLLAALIEKEN